MLDWLVELQTRGVPDKRPHERIKPLHRQLTLTTPDGHQYPAELTDLSIDGAALNVETAPPIGSPVVVGQTSARVVRHFATGIAVKFDNDLSAETFNEDIRL